DGVILEGRSSLDESLVTGESLPVTKEPGSKVIAGTLNQSGGFMMRADKVGRDTLLSQIVKMVADAQRSRAPIQRLADQVSGWFVPIVPGVGFNGTDILRLAATVERASEHPLADAIVRTAKERNLDLGKVEAFDSPTGKGATGRVDGKAIVLGNATFLQSLGIDAQSLND